MQREDFGFHMNKRRVVFCGFVRLEKAVEWNAFTATLEGMHSQNFAKLNQISMELRGLGFSIRTHSVLSTRIYARRRRSRTELPRSNRPARCGSGTAVQFSVSVPLEIDDENVP